MRRIVIGAALAALTIAGAACTSTDEDGFDGGTYDADGQYQVPEGKTFQEDLEDQWAQLSQNLRDQVCQGYAMAMSDPAVMDQLVAQIRATAASATESELRDFDADHC